MAGGTILGGEYGNWASKGDREKSGRILRESRNMWAGMELPDIEKQELDLDSYGDPQLEKAILQGSTALNDISLDPSTRNAQAQALARLQGIASEGGMDSIDRARMADIMSQATGMAKGQRDAISQNLQARGMAGSGLEMVQQQMANQNAAQLANTGGLQTSADAQRRALDALMNSATLGGQMRTQDYGIASDKARAQDAINAFNTGSKQGIQERNVGRTNATALGNTDLRNQQQVANKGLLQQQYENKIAKAQGLTAANAARSGQLAQQAAETQQRHAAQGKAQDDMAVEGLKAGGSMMGMMSDERSKENIKDVSKEDLKEFFAAVNPKLFTYINDEHEMAAAGERIGFMLQDVQGTKLGKLITRTGEDGMLYYDKDNLYGIILAGLSMLQGSQLAADNAYGISIAGLSMGVA